MKVVNIHLLLCSVDSKIYENCCKQKILIIQVMGTLYRYIYHLLLYNIHHKSVSIKNSILLLSCIFESTVSIDMQF